MATYICKDCGSGRTRLVNHGFDGVLLLLMVGTFASGWFGVSLLSVALALFTVAKFILALCEWKRICRTCKSSAVIPAHTPVARSLRRLHDAI